MALHRITTAATVALVPATFFMAGHILEKNTTIDKLQSRIHEEQATFTELERIYKQVSADVVLTKKELDDLRQENESRPLTAITIIGVAGICALASLLR